MFAFDKSTVLVGLVVFCLVMVAYLLREVMDLKSKMTTFGGHVQQLAQLRASPRQVAAQQQQEEDDAAAATDSATSKESEGERSKKE